MTVTEYGDKMWSDFYSRICYFATSDLFLVWWVAGLSLSHASIRVLEERKRRTEKGRRWSKKGGKCPCAIILIFLGKPTQSEASISLAGQRTGGFFLSQLYLSLFILHTCSLKCCQSASETGSNTSSEYFYVSFIERVFDVLLSRCK